VLIEAMYLKKKKKKRENKRKNRSDDYLQKQTRPVSPAAERNR